MVARLFWGNIVALSLLASPAFAQPVPNPDDNPQMTHNDMSRHSHMEMRDRMSRDHMMHWCHSMSYRRMMRNPHCRWMMHHMHHMHHMHDMHDMDRMHHR